jgi:hypothetical protein
MAYGRNQSAEGETAYRLLLIADRRTRFLGLAPLGAKPPMAYGVWSENSELVFFRRYAISDTP